jgi:Phage tail assembly chaperone protein
MTQDEALTIRNSLLKNSDFAVLPDSPYDTPEVRAYRQALRDITKQPGFPDSVEFPANPLDAA